MDTTNKRKRPRASRSLVSGEFHSLLVPVDLTPSSDRILGRVSLLPLTADARVTLLHVVPASLPAAEQRRAQRDASRVLAEEARHLRKHLPTKAHIQAVVKVGAAAKAIGALANEVKADLIVMGRCGRRTLREALLGSTAERVVRQTRLPVLVVRLAPRAAYSRPTLALDLDGTADEVVRLMLRVLSPPRPRIEVVHAFGAPYREQIYPSLSEDEAEERKNELAAGATAELKRLLAAALAKAGVRTEDAPHVKTHVRYGSPRLVVEKAVEKASTDLLVLGTHGYSGAAYIFLGTVAGDLLRAVPCDVLVVPPPPRRG
jgi:nucleotide-binding universal stress UspA family protein